MTDEQLSALLRLKRYEQPPAGYFDKLLTDIHRRQRGELLRRPLWKIAIERMQTFFGEHSMGNLTYAGAMVAVAVCGAGLVALISPGKVAHESAAPALAAVAAPSPAPVVASASARVNLLALDHAAPPLENASFQTDQPRAGVVRQPRYIIDSRPSSYEASQVSFKF